MAEDVLVGGLPEGEFLGEIETLLRVGKADDALDRLQTLLRDLCGPARPLPERFLTIRSADVELAGWDELLRQFADYEQRGQSITAISIDLSWPGHVGMKPDEAGRLSPNIETCFYSDGEAWPFSSLDRTGLLNCYDGYSHKWQGSFDEIDYMIAVEGVDDLYGAVFLLSETENSTPSMKEAAVLGACLVATLVHLTARNTASQWTFPHPVALIVGSNEDYPYFNAPVFAAR